jgi:tetratricopeptide (TPR) repeat protein
MMKQKQRARYVRSLLFGILLLLCLNVVHARTSPPRAKPQPSVEATPKNVVRQDDSLTRTPAKDLVLRPDGERKAQALAHFVEGNSFEESGEMDKALEAYRKVLNVDPGNVDLACRVASLLTRQDEFPEAIDILKDAIKANAQASQPYLQLAFIYAKYLKKTDQAIEYANRGVALDPTNIEAYQRLYEIQITAGDENKALQSLDRATKVNSEDPVFWTRLGKLYAALIFKPDSQPRPEEIKRINEIFQRAAKHGTDNPAVLRDVADYYASSQQVNEAIPLYLRVLELQPDDANAQEKLATGFVLTNQRNKAIELLQEIIKQRPDKYQPYELLAQVLDDQARAFQRENKANEAKAAFAKAAANYEQSLLINPAHANTYLRLADLLLGPLKDAARAVTILSEARRRFPDAPEMIYYLALALREAKQPQRAVATFEEALRQAEMESGEMANSRFYFDYGATAEQAELYDKAADLFKKSIALDPANAGDAYNYLGYMWAEHNMHLEEAAEMVNRALQIDPNNGAYLDSLGWIEFRQGKFDQALADLLRATQNMNREDAVVFDHVGDAYLKLNRVPQALEAWQKAIALDPQNKKVADKIDNAKTKMSKGDSPNPIH